MPVVMEMENTILRMGEDIQRALRKAVDERHWAMVIDLTKCVGCESCTIACKAENKTPPSVSYNIVLKEETGTYPNVREVFVPRPCMQCQEPPCVPVCPVRATFQRPDGIVAIDYDQCIGCRYCVTACPYGARSFDFGESYGEGTPQTPAVYETVATYEYGKVQVRRQDASPIGNVRKCHFCLHRLNEGLLPACISDCIGRSRYFGDLSDPDSLVSELLAERYSFRLREELGTKPSVFYLS